MLQCWQYQNSSLVFHMHLKRSKKREKMVLFTQFYSINDNFNRKYSNESVTLLTWSTKVVGLLRYLNGIQELCNIFSISWPDLLVTLIMWGQTFTLDFFLHNFGKLQKIKLVTLLKIEGILKKFQGNICINKLLLFLIVLGYF